VNDERPAWRRGLRHCLVVFLAVRAAMFLIPLVGIGLVPPLDKSDLPAWRVQPITPGIHNVFDATDREDAAWFLRIATDGYREQDPGAAAFFPVYPLLIRIATVLTFGHALAAALLVSNLSFLASLIALYGLTADEYSDRIARTTVVFLAVFPTAFFFLSPYSESTFLLCAVLALWAARRDRWGYAALFAALAAATRSIGIVLAPALLVEALEQRRAGRPLAPRAAAAAATLLGPLAYCTYWFARSDDFLAPLHAQSVWDRTLDWPWASIWRAIRLGFSYAGDPNAAYWTIDVLVTGAVLVPVVLGARTMRPAFLAYALASLLIPLSYPFPDRPLLSMPRFVSVIFPAFWVLAGWVDRRRWLSGRAVTAVFGAGYCLLAVLFINWYYIF